MARTRLVCVFLAEAFLAVAFLAEAFVATGCGVSSRLDPDIPLAELQSGEDTQLCRFTSDVLADVDAACVAFPRSFDACVAAPPWSACPAGDREADVGSWEACVRASQTCEADATICWHVACL